MDYRVVGPSDLRSSLIGLGSVDFGGRLDEKTARELVAAALDHGVNLIDTGDNYCDGLSEEIVGRAIRGRRNDVLVSTKFTGRDRFRADGSRGFVIRSCEESLRRLGVETIDLFTMHHPDPDTPIEETLEALYELIRSGKVRYAGCSNFAGWQIAEAAHLARERLVAPFVACQMEWNLLKRHVEAEVVPACHHYEVGLMPFYPIASGLLTGKYRKGAAFPASTRISDIDFYARVASPANLERVERLIAFADRHGRTILELALSWLAAQPGVCSVLVGASNADQLRRNVEAVERPLGREELEAIDALLDELADPGVVPFNR